jgi:hypothetical protein
VALIAALGVLAAACSAGETVAFSQAYPVTPETRLVIANDNGLTVVRGDAQAASAGEVRVDATLTGGDRLQFSVVNERGELRITAESDDGFSPLRERAGADITVTAPPGMSVAVSNGNGRAEMRGMAAGGDVSTGNGQIALEGVQGSFSASSGNGRIEVTNGRGSFALSTGNGSVSLNAELAAGSASSVATGNGSISVRLAGTLDLMLDAETDRGDVESSLPLDDVTEAGGQVLKGRAGPGSASLRLRAGNGSINLSAGG